VGAALRRQLRARLAVLDRIGDARVAFRVAVRPPRGALTGVGPDVTGARWDLPLQANEFLPGRRRKRERAASRDAGGARASHPALAAWQVLGVTPGAELAEIKRAYRRLARSVHPDLHPGASEDERRALEVRFAQVTEAYRSLVA
jgi:hypothetical protein